MFYRRYWQTVNYVLMIVSLNMTFAYLPVYEIFGAELSPADLLAGVIYLSRDFAQRELGHKVFGAMLIGAGLSYLLSTPEIAMASVTAFMAGEIIDWGIFTHTKKPLSQRLIWSAIASAPVDSAVFLWGIGRFNLPATFVITLGKFIGIYVVWYYWQKRKKILLNHIL